MNTVLSDDNIATLGAALDHAAEATRGLPHTIEATRALLAELQGTAVEIRGIVADARGVTETSAPELKLAVTRLQEASGNLATMTARLDRLVAANEDSVSRFAGEGLVEFQELARDLRETARAVERMGRRLEDDPSRLLYQPATRGVEIPP